MAKYWGYHHILNAGGCDKELITSADNIRAFSIALVEAIDMVAYGEPQVVHFAAHDPEKGGYTLVQLIETSNICAHFVDEHGEAYLDVFSCKTFEPETVKRVFTQFFAPKTINEKFFYHKA